MGSFLRMLVQLPFLRALLRPLMRFAVGLIAIPLFRLFLKKVVRLQEMDPQLERDLERWFRGCLLLLVATRNMEETLFGWVPLSLQGEDQWISMGLRLLLALSVVEKMPDQELFAVIHPGPPKFQYSKEKGFFRCLREQFGPIFKGFLCQHLNRSSPVFAMLAAVAPGVVGWICYGMACVQYLIIGMVTSRDKALEALSEFDRRVAVRRRELIGEIDPDPKTATAVSKPSAPSADGASLPPGDLAEAVTVDEHQESGNK